MTIIAELRQQIAALETQIMGIQDECTHPSSALVKKSWGNTGNYDPSSDCYGTDYHCRLCDKKWTEVQN